MVEELQKSDLNSKIWKSKHIMAYKLTKIQLRRDTAENWSSVNPVLLPGELGYDTTNKYVKINYSTKAAKWNDLSTIHIPVEAVDNLSAVDANTIYRLSCVTDMGFTLISADSLQQIWSEVAKFEAKDWTGEISASKEEAIAVSLANAKSLIEQLSVVLDPKIKTAQDTADLAQVNVDELSGYVGKFTVEDKTVDTVVKYVDFKVKGLVGALHYISSTKKLDGETDAQAIARLLEEKKHKAAVGDIVIVDTAEYIYDGDIWKLIGDEGSYETKVDALLKLKQALEHADLSAQTALELAKEYSDEQLSAHIKKMHVHDDVEIIEGTVSKGKYCNIVANGIPVVVKQGATEDIVDVWYDNGTKKVTVDHTAYPGGVSVFGGCGNEDDDPTYLPATSVRVESGKLTSVFAGSMNAGNVGIANVAIDGGEITSGVIGGRSDGTPIPTTKKHYNNIGLLNITVNGGKIFLVYGGSNGYSTVDKSHIIINGGTIGYLTAGGANGDVLDAHVEVNGGTVDVYQAVNRGIVCAAELILNGGTIKTCYAGGETTDSTVNGRYYKSSLLLLGGHVNSLWTGKNGDTVDSSFVSGKYAEGIYDEADEVIDKLEKIRAFGEMAYKDVVIEADLSGLFNFDCGDASFNNN